MSDHGHGHGHEEAKSTKPEKIEKTISEIRADMEFVDGFVAENESLQNELLNNPEDEKVWKEAYRLFEAQKKTKEITRKLLKEEFSGKLKVSGFEIPESAYVALEEEIEETTRTNPDQIKRFLTDWEEHEAFKAAVQENDKELYKLVQGELPNGSKEEALRQFNIFREFILVRNAREEILKLRSKKKFLIFKRSENVATEAAILQNHGLSSFEELEKKYFEEEKKVIGLSADKKELDRKHLKETPEYTKHIKKFVGRADYFADKYRTILNQCNANDHKRFRAEFDDDALHVFGRFELAKGAMQEIKDALAEYAESKIFKQEKKPEKEISKKISTLEAGKQLALIAEQLSARMEKVYSDDTTNIDEHIEGSLRVPEIQEFLNRMKIWSEKKKDGPSLDAEDSEEYINLLEQALVVSKMMDKESVKVIKDAVLVIEDEDEEVVEDATIDEATAYFDNLPPPDDGDGGDDKKDKREDSEKSRNIVKEFLTGLKNRINKKTKNVKATEVEKKVVDFIIEKKKKNTDRKLSDKELIEAAKMVEVLEKNKDNSSSEKKEPVGTPAAPSAPNRPSVVPPSESIGVILEKAKKQARVKPPTPAQPKESLPESESKAAEYLEIRQVLLQYFVDRTTELQEKKYKASSKASSEASYVPDLHAGVTTHFRTATEMLKKEVKNGMLERTFKLRELAKARNSGEKRGKLSPNQHKEMLDGLKKTLRLVGTNKFGRDLTKRHIIEEMEKLVADKDLKPFAVFLQGVLSEFKKL